MLRILDTTQTCIPMGRPKEHLFSPEDFQKLSREERQLRGRMSTLKRMIEKREGEIENLKPSIMKEVNKLMKPISKREKEIKDCKEEIEQLKTQIQSFDFEFPSFRVENYSNGGGDYYRGVWYVNSKKYQLYLGSEKKVVQRVKSVHPDYDSKKYDEKMKLVEDVYLNDLQLKYWKDQYGEFKEGN